MCVSGIFWTKGQRGQGAGAISLGCRICSAVGFLALLYVPLLTALCAARLPQYQYANKHELSQILRLCERYHCDITRIATEARQSESPPYDRRHYKGSLAALHAQYSIRINCFQVIQGPSLTSARLSTSIDPRI